MAVYQNGIRLLICLACSIYALAATHAAALYFAWYWTYPWFDILTHFWGGTTVALGAIWFARHSRYSPPKLREMRSLAVVLVAIGVIGVVWEFYELFVQFFFVLPLPPNYFPDTSLDLVMDIIGALVGWGIWQAVAIRNTTPQPAPPLGS